MYAETIEWNRKCKTFPSTLTLLTAAAPLPRPLAATSCCYTHVIQSTSFWFRFCRCSYDGRKDLRGGHSENRKLSFYQCGWCGENIRLLLHQVYVVAECGTVRWAFRIFSYFFSIYKNVKFIILYIYEICLNLIYIFYSWHFLVVSFSSTVASVSVVHMYVWQIWQIEKEKCFFHFIFLPFLPSPNVLTDSKSLHYFRIILVLVLMPPELSSTDRIVPHVCDGHLRRNQIHSLQHQEECPRSAAWPDDFSTKRLRMKGLHCRHSIGLQHIIQSVCAFQRTCRKLFPYIPNHSARRKHIYHSHEWKQTLSHSSRQLHRSTTPLFRR